MDEFAVSETGVILCCLFRYVSGEDSFSVEDVKLPAEIIGEHNRQITIKNTILFIISIHLFFFIVVCNFIFYTYC